MAVRNQPITLIYVRADNTNFISWRHSAKHNEHFRCGSSMVLKLRFQLYTNKKFVPITT